MALATDRRGACARSPRGQAGAGAEGTAEGVLAVDAIDRDGSGSLARRVRDSNATRCPRCAGLSKRGRRALRRGQDYEEFVAVLSSYEEPGDVPGEAPGGAAGDE